MKAVPELLSSLGKLPKVKKIYFASDFHLGAPSHRESIKREKKVIKWLQYISKDAAAIFLLGDIFDFWFEYQSTVPKGQVRFLGTLADLRDQGIEIIIFKGNHDLWYGDYFPTEMGIPIIDHQAVLNVNQKKFFLGHGDGLGDGDNFYKLLKVIFTNRICKWLFGWIHPNIGVGLAKFWSNRSRKINGTEPTPSMGEDEALLKYCRGIHKKQKHDFYVFGHRHLPLEMDVDPNSKYYNLGEWVSQCYYLVFDGDEAKLQHFEP